MIDALSRRLRLTEDALVPLLLFIVLAAFAWITPAQNDTWWHLRSGREMWETGSLLTTERFSYTAFGADFRNYWWVSQLAFYALFSIGGPLLLTIVAGSCAFAAVFGSWRLMQGSWETRLILLCFLIVATAPEWSVRPQVISLVLLVLTAHLIARDRTQWLPLLCIVWANTHPQVVFGVLLAGVAVLDSIIWSRHRFTRDTLIALACAAGLMVSPDGWRYWTETLSTVSASKGVQLQEYRAPLDAGSVPFWVALGVLAFLTFRQRASIAQWRRTDRIFVLAASLLALASLGAARNIAFFAVIAAPAISRLSAPASVPQHRRLRHAGAGAYAMLALAAVIAIIAVRMRWEDHGVKLGWRPLSNGVLEAVSHCPDPMFNQLEDGGYLMWALPSRRVFVDSRMNAYPLELLKQSRQADLYGEYREVFREFGIRCAVVFSDSPLQQQLARDHAMTPIYSDRERTVFQRAE